MVQWNRSKVSADDLSNDKNSVDPYSWSTGFVESGGTTVVMNSPWTVKRPRFPQSRVWEMSKISDTQMRNGGAVALEMVF